ncbi:SDR family oxidoreductase [Pseudomonas sp. NBRC 100443]|uniref:SDR family NAD(P)-dependent oxidoreductase n=1 Tax=Pseudomonas sp. NBRC 100443 TaxID=1113665 RepID=UPI0024A2A3A3|nr:SDR family oxidoreductase [Pseudomonas sp. NBRC 100443]GLU37317.1 oxidoreductase [Pseudomonas sp. NBRC 100443]
MSHVLDRFRLDGRTAIVTGVGPGVGEHVAKAYAAVGANVVLAARSEERLARIVDEIHAAGGKAIGVPTDVGQADQLHNLVEQAHLAFGPVHVVFNNAAAGVVEIDAGIWGNTDVVWQTALAVNVLAPYRLAELLHADFLGHGKGSFITVQSCGGFTPIAPSLAYGSSKAALSMLTRQLAKVLAPHARVNSVCIGSMSPDGVELEHHKGYNLAARNAIQRIGGADEAVGAALLLASDASSYTTGSIIYTEGGRVGTLS